MKKFFTPLSIVCMIVLMLFSGLSLFSASKDEVKPYVLKSSGQEIVSGTLVHWKDLQKVDFKKMPKLRKNKAVRNFENPKKIVKKFNDPDPVVQDSFSNGMGTKCLGKAKLALTSGINFAGMNMSSNGMGWPPDTNGDIGLSHYVQAVNTSIGIYSKSTGSLISATTFDAFFPSAVGSPCDNNNQGDPIVLYDRHNQRWMILDFAWNGTYNGSYYSIAASKTSDPTGAWWTYCLKADNTLMNDYPKAGVWRDGIYITANMFTFSGSYQHAKIWALRTPALYTGTLTSVSVTDSGSKAFSLLPSNDKGSTIASSGTPNYMFALDANEFGGSSQDALYMWKASVNWSGPSLTWSGPWSVNTAAFGLTATRVPQRNTSNTVDSLAGRLMYPANYRNFVSFESIVLCHVCDTSSRRAMRWYEIQIQSTSPYFKIHQQGTYAPDTNHRWMGSIAIDKFRNVAMGYSVSSTTLFPAIRYTGRVSNTTQPLGTMSEGEGTLISGNGSQTSTTRWGDYSSLSIDPSDDLTFWYTTEYYTSSGTNWQTRIGSFQVGASCTACH